MLKKCESLRCTGADEFTSLVSFCRNIAASSKKRALRVFYTWTDEVVAVRYLKLRTLKSCWKVGMWSVDSAAETYSEHFKFLNCFNVEIGFKSTEKTSTYFRLVMD
jgi:hypothetical protein